MNNKQNTPGQAPNNNTSSIVGVAIVLFGLFLLLKNLNFGFLLPGWLFSWKMILLIIGLVIGVNSKFEKKSSVILIAIGSIFLLGDLFDDFSPMKLLFPALAIIVGVFIINRNRNRDFNPPIPPQEPPVPPTNPSSDFDWDKRVTETPSMADTQESTTNSTNDQQSHSYNQYNTYQAENYLKAEAIFGSANKIVLSKNFLGGNLTNLFGSSEINLLQADLQQPVVLDIFQLFGSTKIIVPPHWFLTNDVSSILSENDDRRVVINYAFDEKKKIYITGTSIFGTVIIKNS